MAFFSTTKKIVVCYSSVTSATNSGGNINFLDMLLAQGSRSCNADKNNFMVAFLINIFETYGNNNIE